MQFDKFTIKSQEAIQESQSIAERNGHQEIKPEHLLTALLQQKEGVIIPVLQKMGVNLASLKDDAKHLIDNLPKVSGSGFGQVFASQSFTKVLDQSFSLASNMQDEYVSQEHLFIA
ncbi:MAG: type VI secretion system ATPase TssH, partial [Desulfobulbaceae bacterium]|nr:type VI secretion system ATPase TssH [Desulfobulbaceae bacterium]